MTTYTQELIAMFNDDKVTHYATFYRCPKTIEYKGTIIYFHGGGLIFGHRDDLPDTYISLLTESGFGLLTVDYRLAPEAKLPKIIQSSQMSIDWFINSGVHKLALKNTEIYYMGRSAGAYLATYHAVHSHFKPKGLISFYGYHQLNDASFSIPNRFYLNYPHVNIAQVKSLYLQPSLGSSHDNRYALYLAARQSGEWLNLLVDYKDDITSYSITKEQLTSLPPTFIASSSSDPDVPVRQSKRLGKLTPQSEVHIVESTSHDFDRTELKQNGLPIYQLLIIWLNKLSQVH